MDGTAKRIYEHSSSFDSKTLAWSNYFSKSLRDEDEEVALKWAALERLPTYHRLRRGILTSSEGAIYEVDVENLGSSERRILIEKLVNNADDNEKLWTELVKRFERVGVEIPTIEVRFEHLNIEVEARVGSRALPTVTNYITNSVLEFFSYLHVLGRKKRHLNILHDVSGIIKPGRLTLLLGPPGSGKTTLLLALAGKLSHHLKVSGRVTYNGHSLDEFVPQRTAAYISQQDVHLAEMTVRETLAFSARCQGVGSRFEMFAELSRKEKAANILPDREVDIFMKASFSHRRAEGEYSHRLYHEGLEMCADTLVGNEVIRGISGGERKRLTTGEMLVGPAKALYMDEISTGLDSSTTFQIVNSLLQYTHILSGTTVISLLQPAPETYNLFDDIILLSDGHIVYQGPRDNVLEFFSYMGFECPERKGVADFLQEVTSLKDQQQYWSGNDEDYQFVTAKEFREAFESFHIGVEMLREVETPFDKSNNHPATLITRKYGIGRVELFKACLSREYLLMKRNASFHLFKLFQLTTTAFITMTVFLRTKMHKDTVSGGTIFMAALFNDILRMIFNEISEVSLVVLKLPAFYKHRDLLFFPPWAFALSNWILKIPMSILAVSIWVFTTYYVIGFDSDVGRLFKQYILLFLVCQMASGLFRLIGAAGRNMVIAQTLGSNVLFLLTVFSGFVLSRGNLSKGWIWGYWMSPMMYAQNGIAVIEFLGKSWSQVLPDATEPFGVEVLESHGLFPSAYWYWISVVALTGFTILFSILFTLALTFLKPIGKRHAIIPEDGDGSEETKRSEAMKQLGRTLSPSSEHKTSETHGTQKRGTIISFERFCITFNDVRYSVDMPQEIKKQGPLTDRLELLKGLSGAFRPGVLTALMGMTGAGKTTLLDVLAGRKTGGYIEGDIRISGYPKRQETFARIAGYCEQNDIHSPHISVYESLIYSAWLRLPPEVNDEIRQLFVEEVMELVELTPLRGALVGLPGVSGLSNEQRKRLTIGVELVANPSIIFMDEPTSGLDARAAAIVMRTVRNTVDTGRTVVCTIHQPSIDIFEAFDELFLMKRGGEEIYVGPLGHRSCHLIKYFEGINGVNKIQDGLNPAVWMLDVTSPAEEISLGVDFAELYRNSNEYRKTKSLIQELSIPDPHSDELSFPNQYSQTSFSQFMACLWKQRRSYWHNPTYTVLKLLDTTFVAFLLGAIFWNLGSKMRTRRDLLDSVGSMYTAIVILGVRNALLIQPVIAIERRVFYRESAAGMYSALPYALAQVVVEIPYVLVQSVLYCVVVYSMIGLEWSASKFLWYLFFMLFTFLYYTFSGMMAVAMTPNPAFSSVISTYFYALWNLFAGFLIPGPMIPPWWRWYYWACPMSLSLYGLVASQYGDIGAVLDDGLTVEQYFRDVFGYKHEFLPMAAGGVAGYTFLFAVVYAFCVKSINFQKR
ncbi:Pleiotropic drug resistance protein 1-like protein [Drosera capensis]